MLAVNPVSVDDLEEVVDNHRVTREPVPLGIVIVDYKCIIVSAFL
jgi:hypothetical protein